MRKIRILILLLFAASLLRAQASDQSAAYGRLTGTVLDENGQLVAHASVCTSVTKGNETMVTCRVSTDEIGQFQIEHINMGTYGVFAEKDEDGYSSANHPSEQQVTINTSDPNAYVTLRLGPKGGILSGSVKDTKTGKSIVTSEVHYVALDGGNSGTAGVNDGQFQITVPARTDLIVVVSARGYRGWVYTDAANPSRPVLRLGSGEKKFLDVELEPVAADATAK
jgi:carboxypeptidase family protein